MIGLRRKCPNICANFLRTTVFSGLSRSYLHSIASVRELLSRPVDDEENVAVKGWVRGLREHKDVTFMHISDGSCQNQLQVVIPTCELPSNVDNFIWFPDKEFPIKARKRLTPDYLRQFIHLRPRTNMFSALFRLRSAATKAVNDFFTDDGYMQVHTPIITANDCEGAGEVFVVEPSKLTRTDDSDGKIKDDLFFDVPAYLAVSGQLHLEVMASAFNKVYTFNPTFRAENSRGRHHLSEFWMIEAELAFTESLEDIMSIIEKLLKTVTESLMSNHSEDVRLFLNHVAPEGHEDCLQQLIKAPYIRMPYADAVDILERSTKDFKFRPKWGADLQKEHERYLVQHCGDIPVFVTDFPKEIKAFYARQNDDGRTVAAVDLLGANVGELCGGGLREERYPQLKEKLDTLGNSEEYDWYLDLRRFGSSPHGGFGVGFERYLQAILGINNIRDTIPFPRWRSNCKL